MAERQHNLQCSSRLLHLPLEIFVIISSYLSFADLWYLATSSRYCRALAHQIIWHKYHIDLSKPELNIFNHMVHAALAYVSRHGYNEDSNKLDHFIIQSVANRLAVEIYDKMPLKNWEPCLDFFLDKTLGITLDHVFLDSSLDVVPKHTVYIEGRMPTDNIDVQSNHRDVWMTDFLPTRVGHLLTSFLTTFYPTLTALFDAESTTEIHHRLLLNHINRHLDNMAKRYHNHCQRQLLFISTSKTAYISAMTAIKQHFKSIRLNFRIMIRFLGTLLQRDLLSLNDINTLIYQRIQSFYLIPVLSSTNYTSQSVFDKDVDLVEDEKYLYQRLLSPARNNSSSKRLKTIRSQHHPYICPFKRQSKQQPFDTNSKGSLFNSLSRDKRHYFWQMWLDEIEFQMETYLDLTRAILALERTLQYKRADIIRISSMLNEIISTLISKKSNRNLFMLFTTTITSASFPHDNNASVPNASRTTTTTTTTV